jgi:hypothetical protein
MEISDNAKEKTIYINCKSSTLDFYATEEQRIEIMESGRESVKQFLKKKKSFQKRRNSL